MDGGRGGSEGREKEDQKLGIQGEWKREMGGMRSGGGRRGVRGRKKRWEEGLGLGEMSEGKEIEGEVP